MAKKEQKKHTPEPEKSDKRYLKKFEIVETEVELPIQGQVRDPEDFIVDPIVKTIKLVFSDRVK